MIAGKPRISVVLPDLRGGGAERVALQMANHWVREGYEIDLVLMLSQGEYLPYANPLIRVHILEAPRFRDIPLKLARYLKERRPNITLVHMWPMTSLAFIAWLLVKSPGRLFLCEHTCLSEHVKRDLSIPLLLVKIILHLTYRFASGIVAVSKGAAHDLAELAGVSPSSITVIYNPVVPDYLSPRLIDQPLPKALSFQAPFSHRIVSIGALKESKNFRLLLDAFSEVLQYIDACLVILGHGPEYSNLQIRINELGLQKRVFLPGFDPDPDLWLRNADLFVLSSDYEGFGNVVVEALAAGTPVVSTDCPHGPSEILDGGRYGLLVPVGDISALANAICTSLLKSTWDPSSLQSRALDFSISKRSDEYLKLFGLTSK